MTPTAVNKSISLLCVTFAVFAPLLAAQDASTTPQDAPEQDEPAPRPSGGAPPSDDAFEMGSPPALPDGMTEEQMWPAATAEGWAKPCLIEWQRTFDDAVRVAHQKHQPILVAVNMDGEIASEHFAGVRYRDPATAAMMNRYACVIASVYRHTPRDYDEDGNRVECPRFGTVTCGEHVEAERELYDKYFDGMRVSPRHIVLGLDGGETLDVFYSWDVQTVFTTFAKGVEGWPDPIEPVEPTLADRAASADVKDREFLESAYANGDRETRVAILRSLVEHRVVDQTEVLRSAIFGLDLELAGLAREALAQCETEGALDLMAEALKAPLAREERERLLAAVDRIAETSPRARMLSSLHSGLALTSKLVAPADAADPAGEYRSSARQAVDVQARAETAQARPADPAALLSFAEGLLARGDEEPDRRLAALFADDARNAAERARDLGLESPRLSAVLALTAKDERSAREHAVAAIEGGLLLGGDAADHLTERGRFGLLKHFAGARERQIRAAFRRDGEFPPEWLSDVHAAYEVIARSPFADDEVLIGQYDFLRWIGATPRAEGMIDVALTRFPDSPLVHDRYRAQLLWEGGPAGLEAGYDEMLADAAERGDPATQVAWFSGYASLVAAEHYRRRNRTDEAIAAYEQGLARFERAATAFPDAADSCEHFRAMAHAGWSRVALELGDLAKATDELLAGMTLSPDSSATLDGLGLSPIMTAKMLHARLMESGEPGDAGRASRVQAALDSLDPRLLEPPPSEPADLGRGQRRRRNG